MTNMRTSTPEPAHAAAGESVRRGPRQFVFHAWLTVLALAVVVGTALLSQWQFSRASEKEALRAQFDAMQSAPPRATLAGIALPVDRYARTQVLGQFIPEKTVLHDNQIQAGRAGAHVYTLFQPSEPHAVPVLVNRGWTMLPTDRRTISSEIAPNVPSAQISLVGRVNIPAARTKRLAENADSTLLVQTIDLTALAKQFNKTLAPYIIEQTQSSDMLVRDWRAPDFKIGTHRMYAGQWACFSVLAGVLWLVLSFPKKKAT